MDTTVYFSKSNFQCFGIILLKITKCFCSVCHAGFLFIGLANISISNNDIVLNKLIAGNMMTLLTTSVMGQDTRETMQSERPKIKLQVSQERTIK